MKIIYTRHPFVLIFFLYILENTSLVAQTTYRINTQNVIHTLDEKIYGQFLEHIYNSVNNGLWGDLVWNRSLERFGGTGGVWSSDGDVITQTSLNENIRLLFGETSWDDYEFTLQARKESGNEGFLIMFRANGESFYWCNLGGWSNTSHAIEKGTPGVRWSVFGSQVAGSINTGQWYDIRIRCEGNHFQVWLDGTSIFDFTDASAHLTGQVGVGTWVTSASYRNMVVVDIPGGDTLYKGLPAIDEEVEATPTNWSKVGLPVFYRSNDALNSDFSLKIVNDTSLEAGLKQVSFTFKQQAYHGSFWARGSTPGGLKVRLSDPSALSVEADISAPDSIWKEYTFDLTPAVATTSGTLEIVLTDTGTVYIDQVSMMGQDAIDNNGFRPDLFEAIDSLHPPIIRWPGGYYAELYRWKSGIGKQHERYVYPIEAWNDRDVNSFGTDEFMTLCKDLGAEPIIVINIGHRESTTPQTQYIEEAQHWVEYCNGDTASTWGAVRAENGHPEPYNVKYWEISNEIWLTRNVTTYISFLNVFVPALKAVDPNIKIIACGSGGFDQNWNTTLLNNCADIIDYISTHHYEEIADYRSGVISYEAFLEQLGNNIASSSNPDIKIYMSEWNVWSPIDWRCGLYAAGMLNIFERQGDVFEIGGPALFLRHATAGSAWNNALVNFNNSTWFAAPNYIVMKLWHDYFAPNFIETTGSNAGLNVVSTLSDDGMELYFKAVNTSGSDITVILDIDDSFTPGNAYIKKITAPSLTSVNSYTDPDNIKVTSSRGTINQQQVTFTSPLYSAVVVMVDQYPPTKIDYQEMAFGDMNFKLYPNYPNPFASCTEIEYQLCRQGHVTLSILDNAGRTVTVLVDETREAGRHKTEWNGKDSMGNDVSSGIYYYELASSSGRKLRKMMLIH